MNGKYMIFATIALAIVGIAYLQLTKSDIKPQTGDQNSMMGNQVSPMMSPMMGKSVYKNGTYQATGQYDTPGGIEKMGVTVTLVDGKITNPSLKLMGNTETAKRLQASFNDAYTQEVVGKPIDSINLTVVGGASLTPIGFKDALNQIKAQAKG